MYVEKNSILLPVLESSLLATTFLLFLLVFVHGLLALLDTGCRLFFLTLILLKDGLTLVLGHLRLLGLFLLLRRILLVGVLLVLILVLVLLILLVLVLILILLVLLLLLLLLILVLVLILVLLVLQLFLGQKIAVTGIVIIWIVAKSLLKALNGGIILLAHHGNLSGLVEDGRSQFAVFDTTCVLHQTDEDAICFLYFLWIFLLDQGGRKIKEGYGIRGVDVKSSAKIEFSIPIIFLLVVLDARTVIGTHLLQILSREGNKGAGKTNDC